MPNSIALRCAASTSARFIHNGTPTLFLMLSCSALVNTRFSKPAVSQNAYSPFLPSKYLIVSLRVASLIFSSHSARAFLLSSYFLNAFLYFNNFCWREVSLYRLAYSVINFCFFVISFSASIRCLNTALSLGSLACTSPIFSPAAQYLVSTKRTKLLVPR